MHIPESLFQYFEEAGQRRRYRAGEVIYMEADDASGLYLVLKGRVRAFWVSPRGGEMTFEVLERGRIFGESSFFRHSVRPATVAAVTDVALVICRVSELYPYLCKSGELTISLLQMLSQSCDYGTYLLKKACFYNRYEKVAAFLVEQTQCDNPDKGIYHGVLPYTHEEVAACVGLSRVTTSKVLGEFAKKGYICSQYRSIQVLDKDGLSSICPQEPPFTH